MNHYNNGIINSILIQHYFYSFIYLAVGCLRHVVTPSTLLLLSPLNINVCTNNVH